MEKRSRRARLRRCSATPRSSKPIWGRRVLLEARGLEVHYGGIRAVKGIDLAVDEGELVCLIGANGAGKTSTLKAICRLIPSRAGMLRYRGEDIATSPVHALPRKGLVMVPEGRGIFRQLTVEENLAIGAYALGAATSWSRVRLRSPARPATCCMTPRCARPTWAKASRDAAHLISRVVLFLSRCLILSRAHDSAIVRAGEILPCRIFFLTPIIEATSGKKTTRSQ